MFHLIATSGNALRICFSGGSVRLTLLWWPSEALHLLSVSSKKSVLLLFFLQIAECFYQLHCFIPSLICFILTPICVIISLLHSFARSFLCRDSCLNLYIFSFFKTQFIYVCSHFIFKNCLFLNFFTIFIFSYVVHLKHLWVLPLCCLKGLSALQCAERGGHKDLVSLLSKCLNEQFVFFFLKSVVYLHVFHQLSHSQRPASPRKQSHGLSRKQSHYF